MLMIVLIMLSIVHNRMLGLSLKGDLDYMPLERLTFNFERLDDS